MLGPYLEAALEQVRLCASDPLCGEQIPQDTVKELAKAPDPWDLLLALSVPLVTLDHALHLSRALLEVRGPCNLGT